MNARWHRAVAGLGLALAGALLTGCHAQGTFDVLSEERVAVDLIITGADLNCPHGADALKLTVTTTIDQYGDQVCHVTGETQATYFSPFGITVSPAAEYLVLQANLAGGTGQLADRRHRHPLPRQGDGRLPRRRSRTTSCGSPTSARSPRAAACAPWGCAARARRQWMHRRACRRRRRHRAHAHRRPRRRAGAPPPARPARSAGGPRLSRSGRRRSQPSPHAARRRRSRRPGARSVDGATATAAEDTSWFARPPASGDATNGKPRARAAQRTVTSRTEPDPAHPLHSAWARPPEPSGDQRAG